MSRRSTIWLAAGFLALGATGASAEDTIGPDGNIITKTKLESTCGAALDRFCPELADTPGQTRNQVICLKPYRNSLTPYCRAVVNAEMK